MKINVSICLLLVIAIFCVTPSIHEIIHYINEHVNFPGNVLMCKSDNTIISLHAPN